jgi:hypothetical protein
MKNQEKGKEEVKDNKVSRDSTPNSNHADEPHKGNDFVKDGVQRIKEETSRLSGKALYLRVLELIKQGNLTLEDWHAIGYQEIYERLMKDGLDILKIKAMNAKWKASVGIKNESDAEPLKIPGYEILYNEPYRVNPALDMCPTGELIVTVPFVANHTISSNKGSFKKRELLNFVITSKREVFPCVEYEFSDRDLFAAIPETVLRSRWSMASRRDFFSNRYHVDPFDVYSRITQEFERYIDFGDNRGAVAFCSIYTMLTYFFVLFDTVPYLKFEGIRGSGKSKAGTIFSFLSFNSLMAADLTPAAIFRTVEAERSTLIMDEAEGMKNTDEKFMELLPILNSGWQKTGSTVRVEGNTGKRKPISYSTYSPKVICAINPIFETLRDRSYLITLIKTLDESKANLNVREKDPVWREIRDSLYLLLLTHYGEVLELAESNDIENDLKLIGRDWDKAKPIVTLAKFVSKYAGENGEEIRKAIIDFLKQQVQEEEEMAADSFEAVLISVLDQRIRMGLENYQPEKRTDRTMVTVQLNDLALQVAELEGFDTTSQKFRSMKKSYARKIAAKLKNMGLRKNPRVGHGNFAVFDCTLYDIQLARQRYKVTTENDTNHTNLTNQTNLTNHTNHTKMTNQLENLEKSEDVSMVSQVSQKSPDMDQVDSKLCRILQDDQGKKVSVNQLSQKWSIVTEPREIPALAEIYSRMIQLAGKHPNVRMANDRFYWEESQ